LGEFNILAVISYLYELRLFGNVVAF
jgi:hypothetical protein